MLEGQGGSWPGPLAPSPSRMPPQDWEPEPASTNDPTSPHAGRLLLLRGISGTFRPGVLSALMGASGAGKTVRGLRFVWPEC